MPKLSVIICVYNTDIAKFEECLQSIFNSTYRDFEVVVIDDGSVLDYSSILEKYNINYHKTENAGTLSARLTGIKKSIGQCICFVDSDDTVSFDYFEAMINKADNTNADIVFNDWAFHTDTTRYVCANDSTINSDFLFKGDDVLESFFSKGGAEHSYYVLWNKMYNRTVLEYVVRKIEKLDIGHMVYAEDVLMNYFAFKYAKVITNVHLGYYFYRVHGDQQVTVGSKGKLLNHVKSMTRVFDILSFDLSNEGLFNKYSSYLNLWKRLLCTSHCTMAKAFKDIELREHILKLYGIENYKPYNNESAYVRHKILPNNILEIDKVLRDLWSKDYVKIYTKKNGYAYKTIKVINDLYAKHYILTKDKKNADIIMPYEDIKFKQKILHNLLVYKVGMLLFPKGSKIRKFLKKKI
ncbi:MAG: glycosyltransferase family 2 protein [Clostridia bacterium]|nr:glycosyltransferase family 2 protein [Clostridia bacterium]